MVKIEKQLTNFAFNCWNERRNLKISRHDFSAKCGIHYQTLVNIEQGKSIPSLKIALQIANRLNIPIEQLIKKR